MNNRRLSTRVEIKIKQLIAEGHLKIGDKLPPERELAEAMNVSRHTLREAIKSLETSGLLKSRPGSGTFIFSDLDEAGGHNGHTTIFNDNPRMTEIYQFRWALEPAIAVSAVSNATPAGLKLVRENLDLQEEALAKGDTEMWAQADLDYHLLLSRLTGNSLFIKVMENLSHCIAICVDTSHLNPARMKLYYEGHLGVYNAIVDRDPKKAVFHMEEHLKLLPWQENLKVSTVVHDA
ncbi:hypothetical protein C4J81_08095 [Deltaproteobacteria bacterium Smac51]|nr:hypothetical protein C4J81_08095 [Deltaproteobacteria bacterium Smac51]